MCMRSLLGDAINGNMAERASTKWGLWSVTQAGKVENTVSQATLSATCDETRGGGGCGGDRRDRPLIPSSP